MIINNVNKCLLGNTPTVGGRFTYRSRYGSIVEDTILSVDEYNIISNNGVRYSICEITTDPRCVVRDDKLNKLLNK